MRLYGTMRTIERSEKVVDTKESGRKKKRRRMEI